MKLLFICLVIALVVGGAQAWVIDSPDYTGTVFFDKDGTGSVNINGYTLVFTWEQVDAYDYKAHYLFYEVPFHMYPDLITGAPVITSYRFPTSRLVR